MTDRNQTQLTKPKRQYNGFVREDERVLKWQPQGSRKHYGGYGNYNQMDYEEEKHSLNNRHYDNNGHDRFDENTDDYQQPSGNGKNRRGGFQAIRGRGRGHNPRSDDQFDPEGLVKKARFAERGRGRGRGASNHQTRDRDFNGIGFGHPVDFQETKQRSRGRGQRFQPPRNYENHWLNGNYYQDEEQDYGDEEEKFTSDEIFQPNYHIQLNSQLQNADLFEEKVIQDKRSMQTCNEYRDFVRPEFFQGPQFVIYRQLTSQNRKRRIYSYELEDIQFQQRNQLDKHDSANYPQQQTQYTTTYKKKEYKFKGVYGQEFDFKMEKRVENQFWEEEKPRPQKESKPNQKRNLRQKVKKISVKSTLIKVETSKQPQKKNGKRVPNKKVQEQKPVRERKQRNGYEEHLNEEQIKKGLENGTLFEGILRVSQNNRKRAFVTVNDIKVDVMVDGLNQQNRALDGDTVIIELLPAFKWTEYASNNVVVGKDSLGKGTIVSQLQAKGYTNDTAIETRIVDLEVLGEVVRDEEDKEELLEVREDFIKQQSIEKLVEASSDSDEEESSSEDEDEAIKEDEIANAIHEAEEEMESNQDSDEEVGYGFIDDEKVSSGSEEEKKVVKINPQEGRTKEIPNKEADAKVYRVKQTNDISAGSKSDRLAEINKIAKDLRPMGKVKAIIKSPNREKEHLVTLMPLDKDIIDERNVANLYRLHQEKRNAASCGIYAVPVSKKLPWMAIFNIPAELVEDLKAKKKPNHRYYIVKIQAWKANSIRPACNVISSIGEAGNLDAESLRILKSHDIWSDEYETEGQKINEKVHESLRIFTKDIDPESGEWMIHPDELKSRVDLREKRIFTIDPITAKDLDDALSIDKISDFIYEIGVHIADVSYFVQQGTDLDKEAQLRCTSVYFVHKVYPMLPRLLCERLCSLNPKVDRLAYSIFFRMDIRNGEIDRSYTPRIARTVIRSCAKWNYQLVQDVLDNKITNEGQLPQEYQPINGVKFSDMRNDCFLMNEIAQKRRKKRLENGSILLQNREFTFVLDQETKMPMSFQESYRIESKFLVEEYMLLANILIAEHLHQYCKDKTLLRAHPDLDGEKRDKLKQFFDKVGLGEEIDLTDSKTLSTTLEILRDKGDSARFNVAMRKFLTCLQCAKYMCINQCEQAEYQHFGLNFPLYTHFTSPIRRYADLLVHRLVTLTLQHKEATRELIELMDYSNFAELCSEKSYNAKRASQQCTRLFHCLLLKSQGVKVFETLLFDMDQGSISIYIDEVNMHQKIRLRDDPRIDSLLFFEEHMIIVAHLKGKNGKGNGKAGEEKRELFKKVKNLSEFEQHFSPDEFLIMRIFDKVKVKVETTTEFPLDIKCTLMFTPEDLQEYDKLQKEQESRGKAANGSSKAIEIALEEIENLNDEV